MKKFLILAASCSLLFACNSEKKDDKKGDGTTTETKATPQSEFADAKYTDMGKKMQGQFASGDIKGWLENFSDKAVYAWSNGDSLAGKSAIENYWTNRRKNVLDSISFSNDIWIPIKVNTPQRGPDMAGIWLLSWYQVTAKYKNGKSITFWTHVDHHFDSTDKVDRSIQYIDFAQINKAMGK